MRTYVVLTGELVYRFDTKRQALAHERFAHNVLGLNVFSYCVTSSGIK